MDCDLSKCKACEKEDCENKQVQRQIERDVERMTLKEKKGKISLVENYLQAYAAMYPFPNENIRSIIGGGQLFLHELKRSVKKEE